ncbi:hypothetical protein RJ55_07715 [Drechmeria coniospora]|nr:hypothetical protein RJ55_07715 [Drechmeria coniospora]
MPRRQRPEKRRCTVEISFALTEDRRVVDERQRWADNMPREKGRTGTPDGAQYYYFWATATTGTKPLRMALAASTGSVLPMAADDIPSTNQRTRADAKPRPDKSTRVAAVAARVHWASEGLRGRRWVSQPTGKRRHRAKHFVDAAGRVGVRLPSGLATRAVSNRTASDCQHHHLCLQLRRRLGGRASKHLDKLRSTQGGETDDRHGSGRNRERMTFRQLTLMV